MKWRRTISLGLAAAMTASAVLAGCGGDSGANGNASRQGTTRTRQLQQKREAHRHQGM